MDGRTVDGRKRKRMMTSDAITVIYYIYGPIFFRLKFSFPAGLFVNVSFLLFFFLNKTRASYYSQSQQSVESCTSAFCWTGLRKPTVCACQLPVVLSVNTSSRVRSEGNVNNNYEFRRKEGINQSRHSCGSKKKKEHNNSLLLFLNAHFYTTSLLACHHHRLPSSYHRQKRPFFFNSLFSSFSFYAYFFCFVFLFFYRNNHNHTL
jgi:hypothetical protein